MYSVNGRPRRPITQNKTKSSGHMRPVTEELPLNTFPGLITSMTILIWFYVLAYDISSLKYTSDYLPTGYFLQYYTLGIQGPLLLMNGCTGVGAQCVSALNVIQHI